MDTGREDDLTLAQNVAAGDDAALRVLYDRYADLLFAFIYARLGGVQQDAEEIWQDTLVAALQSLHTYRGQSQLFTWLCAIARRKVADYWRRQGPRTKVFSALPPGQLAGLMDSAPLPEEIVLERLARTRVIQALAVLAEDYRTALVARYADGRTVGEVAQMLGKTYKAAESLLSRARAAFRAAMQRLDGEDANER